MRQRDETKVELCGMGLHFYSTPAPEVKPK